MNIVDAEILLFNVAYTFFLGILAIWIISVYRKVKKKHV